NVSVRIDDPDNCAVSRRLVTLEWKGCFLSPAPKDQLPFTGSNGVKGHHGLSACIQVGVEGLYDEKFSAFQRLILDGRDDGTDYLTSGIASSTHECGRGMTCTLPSSPTSRAAPAPASVAALTAATSPRTMAVTKPAPIFS